MESNGTSLSSLAERLRARTEKDAQEIESLTRKQFDSLSRSLAESSQNALASTENAILKNIAELEKNISSRCQNLKQMFDRKYWLAWILSGGIVLVSALTAWGLIAFSKNQITDLRQEVAALSARKETLADQNSRIWATFKGLEPYRADGKEYLLAPPKFTFSHAGTVGEREAWMIVRK